MKKILIVDNDVNTAQTMKAVVDTNKGYNADVVYGGKEALAKMKKMDYDGVLLDLMMPEVSGIDVCKKMSKDKKMKHIPVVVVSALPVASPAFQKSQGKFDELNVIKGVVEKPFEVKGLLGAMKAAVST